MVRFYGESDISLKHKKYQIQLRKLYQRVKHDDMFSEVSMSNIALFQLFPWQH